MISEVINLSVMDLVMDILLNLENEGENFPHSYLIWIAHYQVFSL